MNHSDNYFHEDDEPDEKCTGDQCCPYRKHDACHKVPCEHEGSQEAQALTLRLSGYSYQQIADEMNLRSFRQAQSLCDRAIAKFDKGHEK